MNADVADRLQPLTVKSSEAAKLIGVSKRTLRNWEREGRLTGRVVGGVKLYSYQAIKELVGVK